MLKLNVGLSRKVGEANYGSRGASVNLELEVESGLASDPDALRDRARQLFRMARASVDEELNGNGHSSNGNQTEIKQLSTGNGGGGNGHRATDKQLGYARQLAGQIQGLGVRRLDVLANRMFAKPIAELSTLDASGLIDTIKAIKAGEVKLDDALNGAAV